MKLSRDVREFISLLNSHGVEYLVVGGYAVAYHGHPRLTGGIDFWVRPSEDNARRLLAVLDASGFAGLGIGLGDLVTPGKVVQLGLPPNRIDLVTAIAGVDFDAAWSNLIAAQLDGLAVAVVGYADLLKNKRAVGRARDLADVEEIESVAAARPTN